MGGEFTGVYYQNPPASMEVSSRWLLYSIYVLYDRWRNDNYNTNIKILLLYKLHIH